MSFFSRLFDALDERTGVRALLKEAGDEPVPGGARFSYVFGSVLVALMVVQAITGVLLMTAYAPSSQTAWASVHYVSFRMSAGWLVRGIHHFGSSATVIVLAFHLAQTTWFGAYKKPREINWWFGLLLLFVVLGFALTGYLLPWDQKGYWATRVATNILGTVPLVGAWLQRLVQGGSSYGNLTLTRFFALHVGVLPATLVLLVTAHVYLFRKHGVTPPANADLKKVDRFYPKQLAFDVIASTVVIGAIVWLAVKNHGAPLDAPADPSSDYPARPEWYFLALFQLLKYFHGSLEIVGTLVVPGLAFAFLFALPLLDKKPNATFSQRKHWISLIALGYVGLGILTWLSMRADRRDEAFKKARAAADERAAVAIEIAKRGVPPEGPLVMLERDPELRGKDLFTRKCLTCHTFQGKGEGHAPELEGWGSASWVDAIVRDPDSDARFGKTQLKGQMPSMTKPTKPDAPVMKEEDVKAVVAFVVDNASNPKGREVFENACNGCHRFEGRDGDDNDYAPDLTGWGSYRWLRAQIANPHGGTTYKAETATLKGHMPGFETDADVKGDIDLLAQWVFRKTKGREPSEKEISDATAPAPAPSASASTKPK